LEVRRHRFAAGVNRVGEAGKDPRVRSVRRGIRKWGVEPRGPSERGQKIFENFF